MKLATLMIQSRYVLVSLLFGNLVACSSKLDATKERMRISNEYEGLIVWMEAEYVRTGSYPLEKDVPKEYRDKMQNDKLKGTYFSDGKRAEVKFGNYIYDGFVIFWASEVHSWSIDG